MSMREYVFRFADDGNVMRISHVKWRRIREGNESLEEYSNQSIHIAYAYILQENRKPNYCPRIDGAVYYFDHAGRVLLDKPHYFDLLQDLEEAGGVISLRHRRMKKEASDKYCWTLNTRQIQAVINLISWR